MEFLCWFSSSLGATSIEPVLHITTTNRVKLSYIAIHGRHIELRESTRKKEIHPNDRSLSFSLFCFFPCQIIHKEKTNSLAGMKSDISRLPQCPHERDTIAIAASYLLPDDFIASLLSLISFLIWRPASHFRFCLVSRRGKKNINILTCWVD